MIYPWVLSLADDMARRLSTLSAFFSTLHSSLLVLEWFHSCECIDLQEFGKGSHMTAAEINHAVPRITAITVPSGAFPYQWHWRAEKGLVHPLTKTNRSSYSALLGDCYLLMYQIRNPRLIRFISQPCYAIDQGLRAELYIGRETNDSRLRRRRIKDGRRKMLLCRESCPVGVQSSIPYD